MGFWWLTDTRMDFGGCRVAFATEKLWCDRSNNQCSQVLTDTATYSPVIEQFLLPSPNNNASLSNLFTLVLINFAGEKTHDLFSLHQRKVFVVVVDCCYVCSNCFTTWQFTDYTTAQVLIAHFPPALIT